MSAFLHFILSAVGEKPLESLFEESKLIETYDCIRVIVHIFFLKKFA